ncbi:hypothetical protein CROQUDRAFT_652479 [Cronartium quercuum f. sp. fusiforme G11]|uniref:Uncharacterized protein n=1 Tax=Cronartium quercuum f. sp. fusiforme G11 TaxID=708437 RepID=A0A9P6NQF0_9BASI|nr:hypothetical protein CROQUDRAFT_652479 [Cronartium quercuum f. sp. fusiforme G11]
MPHVYTIIPYPYNTHRLLILHYDQIDPYDRSVFISDRFVFISDRFVFISDRFI